MVFMEVWRWMKRTPWTAHIIRATDRFNARMGSQLAGGITYFSVLTMIPVLAFGFSGLGFVLTVYRHEWLVTIKDAALQEIGTVAGGKQAISLMERALRDWQSVLWFALVSAIYSGSGWMGNLRGAIRAQWRPEFDLSPPGRHWAIEWLVNLFYFVCLIAALAFFFTVTILAGNFAEDVVRWLGLGHGFWVRKALQLGAFVLTVALGSALFLFLYSRMPQYQAPHRDLLKGSIASGLALALLLNATTMLVSWFSRGLATIVFGNIVIIMIFFNMFARLILFGAAWIATSYQPAVPRRYSEVDLPLKRRSDVMTVPGHWEIAEAARLEDEKLRQREQLAREESKRLDAERKRHKRYYRL